MYAGEFDDRTRTTGSSVPSPWTSQTKTIAAGATVISVFAIVALLYVELGMLSTLAASTVADGI